MTRTTTPTVSRRWLALEMRRLRKERRLSQARVAKALGCQVPKISLMENGQRQLQDHDLKILLELFEVPDERRQQYVDELENAQAQVWWELYDELTVPDWYGQFIGLEQGADRIRAYQPAVVHGLLQTKEYAAELNRDTVARLSEEKAARRVEIRRRRQRILDDRALDLSVILDESALHRIVGSRETTRAQLEHVVALCGRRPHVNVQIVPFDRDGAYEAACGSFTILGFPFETDPGVVYKERRSGAEFLDDLEEIDAHSLTFRRLSELALSREESLRMLRDRADHYARSDRVD